MSSVPPLIVTLGGAMFTFPPGKEVTVGRGEASDVRIPDAGPGAKQLVGGVRGRVLHVVARAHEPLVRAQAALLEREAGADRVRLLRCLDERRRTENWTLLKRQLASAGRFLVDLPGRWLP